MLTPSRLAPALALGLGLLACSETVVRWEKDGVEPERRRLDVQDCATRASEELASHRTFAREQFYGRALEAEEATRNPEMSVQRRLIEGDIGRLRERFFGECMREKGYHPVPVGGAAR